MLPKHPEMLRVLRDDDLRKGKYAQARARYARPYPELLEAVPTVNSSNVAAAIDLTLVLKMSGDDAGATRLLALSEAAIQDMPRLGTNGFGIADVYIYALRGEKRKALLALRNAVRAGHGRVGACWRPEITTRTLLHPQRTRVQGRLRRHRARHGAAARRARRASEGCAARTGGDRHVTDTPTQPSGEGVWDSLRRRKVVQWGVAYVAAAWGLLQGLEYFSGTFDWPRQIQQLSTLALLIGLPIVLVLAWYHGDRGEQRIRGTELTIVALLLLLGGGIVWYYQHAMETSTVATPAAPSAPAIPTDASIAVLPFANMSGDPADEYFSDGLAEELLNSLTRIDGLKVAARTTSFQYKDRTGDVSEIARQLRVAHILEGSVRRSGSRVRVTAQLIKASDGYHLWSESYDRELQDIFEVQSDIAGRIAEKLRVELVPRPTTSDTTAFDLLLRARHLMRQRNEQALLESRKLLEQALDHDPKYAAAWSALAMVLNLLPVYASGKPEKTFESAEKAARRAMELDPAMAEPLTVLASLNETRGDWVEADRLYEKALALDPEDPTSQFWHAIMLSRAGYLVEAGPHLQRALALDPTNGALHRMARSALRRAGSI